MAEVEVAEKLVNVKEPALVRLNPPPSIFDAHGVCTPPPPQPVQLPVTVRLVNVADGAVIVPLVTDKFPERTVAPLSMLMAFNSSIRCESVTILIDESEMREVVVKTP